METNIVLLIGSGLIAALTLSGPGSAARSRVHPLLLSGCLGLVCLLLLSGTQGVLAGAGAIFFADRKECERQGGRIEMVITHTQHVPISHIKCRIGPDESRGGPARMP